MIAIITKRAPARNVRHFFAIEYDFIQHPPSHIFDHKIAVSVVYLFDHVYVGFKMLQIDRSIR